MLKNDILYFFQNPDIKYLFQLQNTETFNNDDDNVDDHE